MRTASPCPTSDELASFGAGEADGERLAAMSGHLDTCPGCRARLDGSDRLIGLLRLKPPPAPTAEAGYRRLESWVFSDTALFHDAPCSLDRPRLRPADPGTADLGRVGPYRVLRVLGEGSMGVVYEARDTRLDRQVALKVLKPSWSGDDASRRRFLGEARAAAQVVDDHIVAVHDIGEDDGLPYIAMALVKGQSLEERLRERPRPPVAEVVDLAGQIARGLAAAHARGLVHRDVKPANIWVEEVPVGGQAPHGLRVKLLDFGLARHLGDDVRLTTRGMVLGTPAYMAPEAAGGEADARSDLFGLGVILYRMTTATLPFPGKDVLSIVHALANTHPTPPHRVNPAVPGRLSRIVMKLLEKNPANRFASAEDVVVALGTVETPRRRWLAALVAAGFVACLATALTLTFWRPKAANEAPDDITPIPALPDPAPPAAEPRKEVGPTARDGPSMPEEGQYYRIKNARSNKALAVENQSQDDGAPIVQLVAGPKLHQQWKFVKVGAYYKIINRHSGKALNVQNASMDDGAAIIQWDVDDDAENQHWSIEKSGNYLTFRARHSGQALAVADSSRGRRVPLVQRPFNSGRNQLFELVLIKQ